MEDNDFKSKVSALIEDLHQAKLSKMQLEKDYANNIPDDVHVKITELEALISKIERQLSFLQ